MSVALALVGDPKVLVLDEPSTGMDPASKRFIWAVIQQLRRDHTVILTTHSMEECEAVAQRVGIMVGGCMAALGPLQHLKTRFGQHYHIDAVCSRPEDVACLSTSLAAALPGTELIEQHGLQVRFRVPLRSNNSSGGASSLSQILDVLHTNTQELGIRAYQASQATLEQIFLDLAAENAQA